jgi:hypothetical protein
MPEQPQFTASALLRYSETLRRQLYDAVVLHLWTPLVPGDYVPGFTPDAAQLTVMHSHGRWIVVYLDLDEPADAPPDQRAVMSRILAAPDRPFGIQLSEI